MFMTDVNDVKIYNLSAGKSLPDWLTDRKRRAKLHKNVDLRRKIELIQDFDMPGISTNIRVSNDGQYIIATGTYKPRIKCYDVTNLSLKFERCFDSDVVSFEVLSDDYNKMVFLHCDRYIELHAAHGRHYKLRIPRFGRDMSYHIPTCDLFIVGTSSDIYRLNLERGQFLQPYTTDASCINVSEINPEHQLLCVGTQEGKVEAWDPRNKNKCGTLDVALKIENYKTFPSVTSLKFKNGLQMAVGTSTGQILVYDIRSNEPLIIKDHFNKLPIKKIDFNKNLNYIYSMDSAILKVWEENTGKQIAYIESTSNFNDFATIPNTGMFFFAQEDIKMQTFYIPTLGPAPRWCSFLDNLTEEIESEHLQNIYDDYKFLTKQELLELGLDHLEGTNLLRAYMHGYFVDMRLYNKARLAIAPFAFEKYRKEKIQQQIESLRPNRLLLKSKLPKVNQEMALKLMDEKEKNKKDKGPSLLDDNRFKAMFENPDFEIDKQAESYRLLAPVLTRLDENKARELKKRAALAEERAEAQKTADGDEEKNGSSDDDDIFSEKDEDESSEDDRVWSKEVKNQYRTIRKERAIKDELEIEEENHAAEREEKQKHVKEPKMYEVQGDDAFKFKNLKKVSKFSLGERVAKELNTAETIKGTMGNREITFKTGYSEKDARKRLAQNKRHREERKKVIRPIKSLRLKKFLSK